MADHIEKPGRRSTPDKPRLRSRGFLSHGGGAATGGEGDEKLRHKSRGSRPVAATSDGQPESLAIPAPRRPYVLDDK